MPILQPDRCREEANSSSFWPKLTSFSKDLVVNLRSIKRRLPLQQLFDFVCSNWAARLDGDVRETFVVWMRRHTTNFVKF